MDEKSTPNITFHGSWSHLADNISVGDARRCSLEWLSGAKVETAIETFGNSTPIHREVGFKTLLSFQVNSLSTGKRIAVMVRLKNRPQGVNASKETYVAAPLGANDSRERKIFVKVHLPTSSTTRLQWLLWYWQHLLDLLSKLFSSNDVLHLEWCVGNKNDDQTDLLVRSTESSDVTFSVPKPLEIVRLGSHVSSIICVESDFMLQGYKALSSLDVALVSPDLLLQKQAITILFLHRTPSPAFETWMEDDESHPFKIQHQCIGLEAKRDVWYMQDYKVSTLMSWIRKMGLTTTTLCIVVPTIAEEKMNKSIIQEYMLVSLKHNKSPCWQRRRKGWKAFAHVEEELDQESYYALG